MSAMLVKVKALLVHSKAMLSEITAQQSLSLCTEADGRDFHPPTVLPVSRSVNNSHTAVRPLNSRSCVLSVAAYESL